MNPAMIVRLAQVDGSYSGVFHLLGGVNGFGAMFEPPPGTSAGLRMKGTLLAELGDVGGDWGKCGASDDCGECGRSCSCSLLFASIVLV